MRFLMLGLLLPLISFADWTKLPSNEFEMDSPPRKGSAEFKRDYAELHRLQDERADTDCALARKQEFPTFALLFANAESPLTKAEKDKSAELVGRAMKLSERIATYFKNQFERERPYDVDSELKPCAKKPGGAKSYPSSHAAASKTGACVLAKIFPGKRKAILDYGHHLGELRAIVGVHHPSDVEAGQQLGQEVCDRLLKDEEFQEELKDL